MQSVETLVAAAVESGCSHVVLTGGEPLLPTLSSELVRALRAQSLHVTIETAGTIDRELTADLMSISPKLAGSGPKLNTSQNSLSTWIKHHEQRRWRPDVIRQLIGRSLDYQVKFVVDEPGDFAQAAAAASELGVPSANVWIMPQAITEAQLDQQASWLRPLCQQRGFQYCDRMHVRWYGNRRGT